MKIRARPLEWYIYIYVYLYVYIICNTNVYICIRIYIYNIHVFRSLLILRFAFIQKFMLCFPFILPVLFSLRCRKPMKSCWNKKLSCNVRHRGGEAKVQNRPCWCGFPWPSSKGVRFQIWTIEHDRSHLQKRFGGQFQLIFKNGSRWLPVGKFVWCNSMKENLIQWSQNCGRKSPTQNSVTHVLGFV